MRTLGVTCSTLPKALPRDNTQLHNLAFQVCEDLVAAKDMATWETRVENLKPAKYYRLTCVTASLFLKRGRVDLAERLLYSVAWRG